MGTVTLNSLKVFGIVEEVDPAAPGYVAKRTHRWGSRGENSLTSPPKGRPIHLRVQMHKAYATEAALQADIEALERRIGEAGDLAIDTGAYTRTYKDCEFEGLARLGGPLPDVGDGLGEGDGCWHQAVGLKFYQLTP